MVTIATRPLLHLSRVMLHFAPGGSTTNVSRNLMYRACITQAHFYSTPSTHDHQWHDHATSPKQINPSKPPTVRPTGVLSGSPIHIDEVVKAHEEEYEKHKNDDPADLKHFKRPITLSAMQALDPTMVPRDVDTIGETTTPVDVEGYNMPHPIYEDKELHSIEITHRKPEGIVDWLALYSVRGLRTFYDIISGYNRRPRDVKMWLNRIIFLETVAGVPGMVGAMIRHLHSLRKMRRDHGWIHTLLEEAENERMHLMTALQLKQPSIMFRTTVVVAQASFVTMFSIAYMIGPTYCHRMVGYLEEEAVVTYTKCLKDIEDGLLTHWKTQQAPLIAKNYWHLHPTATMKDVILVIRADEAHHRVVNHTLASMDKDGDNPYKPGE